MISVLIVGTVAIALLYQLQFQPQSQGLPKERAEDYFEVINATVNDGWFESNETILFIRVLGFTLKAVGGDAHDVIIQSTAMSEPRELVQPLLKNQSRYIELAYKYGYMSTRTEKGFPVEIKIWSREAEGTITVFLEY